MKVRAVLTGALRKLGVVGGVGRRTPSDQEFADCLPILLSMYRSLISAGTFGRLRDVIPRGDYVAGENQRIYRRYNEAQEILLPDMVSDCGSWGYVGCDDVEQQWSPPNTDYGRRRYGYHNQSNRRTIRDNSVVTIVDEFSHDILEAMYDGQRKAWFILSDLDTGEEWDESNSWSTDRLNQALDLEAPLSHRNYNGLVSLVATMLADDFGAEVSGTIMQHANQFRSGLTTNYSTYKRDDN